MSKKQIIKNGLRKTSVSYLDKNEDSIKNEKRKHIVNTVTQDVTNIFTFPGEEALCASLFKKYWPHANIYGVERNVRIKNNIKNKFPYIQIIGYNFETFNKPNVKFQLYNLDFTGYLNDTIINRINELKDTFDDGCIISITVKVDDRTLDDINECILSNCNLEYIHHETYKNTDKSALMYFSLYRYKND